MIADVAITAAGPVGLVAPGHDRSSAAAVFGGFGAVTLTLTIGGASAVPWWLSATLLAVGEGWALAPWPWCAGFDAAVRRR